MATNAEDAYAQMSANVGRSKGTSGWFEITQDVIDQFAHVTHDHEGAFLPMSLLSHFNLTLSGGDAAAPALTGVVAGINYGFDNVRFVTPVKLHARIRANSVVKDVVRKGDSVDEINTITVEIEGESEPALVADWIIRTVFAG